ncbi:MAG: TerB family tellurite resistance protein [Aureliella sp.]
MILIGTMEWASTIDRGDFFCPVCNAAKSYQRKVSRPFLTLYFIPVVPIGGLREFVLCRSCRKRFDPEILSPGALAEVIRAPQVAGEQAPFETELLRLIALMMVEDDQVTEPEVAMATRVYQSMIGRPLPRYELDRACREVVALRIKPARYVGRAGEGMTYDQKLMAVQAMFAVAGAEGQISPRRLQSLMNAQQQLGLDEVAFQTAIKDASQWVA